MPQRRSFALSSSSSSGWQPYLFDSACLRCPIEDCWKRGSPQACPPIEFQLPTRAPLSHRSPQLPGLLGELQDFALPKTLPRAPGLPLPQYLPQVDPSTALAWIPKSVGISLTKFISLKGRSYEAGLNNVAQLRELGVERVYLVGTGLDSRLEGVWRDPQAFIEALQESGVVGVLGPAFSIYKGRVPLEQNANRARNFSIYQKLTEAGIPAVAAVGFSDDVDAGHIGHAIESLRLESVFVDLQSTEHAWLAARSALSHLVAHAPSLQRVIVNGVADPLRVPGLRTALPSNLELVLTNQNAYQLARARHDYYPEQSRLCRRRSPLPSEDLFARLAGFYTAVAAGDTTPYHPGSVRPRLL